MALGNLSAQTNDENIIQKALADELNRSMNELQYKDYNLPFYIAYNFSDGDYRMIAASNGGTILKFEKPIRGTNTRVMAGDYHVSDENFEDLNQSPYDYGDISPPVDNDYFGIRRTFWKSTDKIYKAASEIYAHKMDAFQNSTLNLDSLLPDDLSKAPVIQVDLRKPSTSFDVNKWEQKVKTVSAVFNQYPDVEFSMVSFEFMEVDVYIVNSEGTSVIQTVTSANITVEASVKHIYGFSIDDQLHFVADIPQHLPGEDSLIEATVSMAKKLQRLQNAGLLDQNYSGPVLMIDQTAGALVESIVQQKFTNFASRRRNTYLNQDEKIEIGRYDKQGMDRKLGKKIIDTNISIYSIPSLKNYNGHHLIAAFDYDAEGVKPPDTLELVKSGMLMQLLNGRTPTSNVPLSNGHKRYIVNFDNLYGRVAPGPVFFEVSNSRSLKSLKKQLLDMAVEEGLDYAIIIRKSERNSYGPSVQTIYKVDVENGEEEQLLSGNISRLSNSEIKDMAGFSSEQYVYQPVNGASIGTVFGQGGADLPASYIHPKGILLKSLEIDLIDKPLNKEEKFIPSPLVQ